MLGGGSLERPGGATRAPNLVAHALLHLVVRRAHYHRRGRFWVHIESTQQGYCCLSVRLSERPASIETTDQAQQLPGTSKSAEAQPSGCS